MTARPSSATSVIRHWLAVISCMGGLVITTSPVVHAEPDGGGTPSGASGDVNAASFPDVTFINKYFDTVRYDDYFTRSSGGVWFSTPLGLDCGIWDRGAFGCRGEIRGAPPGTTNVGWVSGQIRMRWDPGFAVLMPPGRAERELPPRTYISYNGTTCATMGDGSTFCYRGPFRLFVMPTRTWLAPP